MKKIIIFTLSDCIHCIELKFKLDENNIEYEDIDILKNSELWESLKINVVPSIVIIRGHNNGEILIPEIHFNTVDDAVEILKNK